MSEFVFKLPDLGEGTVEAEIVEWHVRPGDAVTEDQIIVDVMTDKANVEVPAPVTGVVVRTSGEPGDMVAVGAELIVFQTGADRDAGAAVASDTARANAEPALAEKPASEPRDPEPTPPAPPEKEAPTPTPSPTAEAAEPQVRDADASTPRSDRKILTSPAVRRRAKELGIDLAQISGSGPRGRILKQDLASHAAGPAANATAADRSASGRVEERRIIGVRRVIAQRMRESKQEIPHFAYVEEVDVSALESLRKTLNDGDRPSLSVLPFIAIALMQALRTQPHCNARFDSEREILAVHEDVHLGIATQTADGLKVPVVRNAHRLELLGLYAEIARVADAARNNTARREELTGSTVTITSLGRIGGIVTTPVINYPEVAIIGVNKAVPRPVVVDNAVTVRTMMNLSGSFDHRFVDGYDAAVLIQEMKKRLEQPALLFMPAD